MNTAWSFLSNVLGRPGESRKLATASKDEGESCDGTAQNQEAPSCCRQEQHTQDLDVQSGCRRVKDESDDAVSDRHLASACGCTPAAARTAAVAASQGDKTQETEASHKDIKGKILYASQKGTAAAFAKQLADRAMQQGIHMQLADLAGYEVEHLWNEQLIVLVMSTYEEGAPPEKAR